MAVFLLVLAPAASAVPISVDNSTHDPVVKSDNRPDPLTTKQLALKETALQGKLNGKATGKVKEVAKGQYVQLAREGRA